MSPSPANMKEQRTSKQWEKREPVLAEEFQLIHMNTPCRGGETWPEVEGRVLPGGQGLGLAFTSSVEELEWGNLTVEEPDKHHPSVVTKASSSSCSRGDLVHLDRMS